MSETSQGTPAPNDALAEVIAAFQKAATTLQQEHGLDPLAIVGLTATPPPPKTPRRKRARPANALHPRRASATTVDIVPSRLREARAYSDVRQRGLLETTGIPYDVISKIEAGRGTALDREAAAKLAGVMGVTLVFLCGEGSTILGEDKPLGDRLRIARKRGNWSRKALADRLGVTMNRVSLWEEGSHLHTADLPEIARLLDVPLAYLTAAAPRAA